MDSKKKPRAPHGLQSNEIQRIFGVTRRTAVDWSRNGIPQHLAKAAAALQGGNLAALSPTWSGWRVIAGQLVSPEGLHFTPGEIRGIPFRKAQIEEYQRQQRFAAQTDWINGRWETPRPAPAPATERVTAAAKPQDRSGQNVRFLSRRRAGIVPLFGSRAEQDRPNPS